MEGSLVKRDEPLLMNTSNSKSVVSAKSTLAKNAAIGGGIHSNDVLNTLLPPIALEDDDGNIWKQYCTNKTSGREDVFDLQDKLDEGLSRRQARNNGICPVREDLYSQAFDELLRQVTLETPERGLVLLRVRDEIRMSLAAYQTLYLNAVAFGTRKAVEAEETVATLDEKHQNLIKKRQNLQSMKVDLMDKVEIVQNREMTKTKTARESQKKEREFIEKQIKQLEDFLKTQQQ
jgi:dynein light intermediate chain, axonemal|tara:strand:+ start:51 stop:749 length:699 start_codon:yes stop_codon:yes gene_type:complete